jgi:xanthine/uracil permease
VTSRRGLELDLVIVACAVSAGIHAALAPAHFAEATAAGAGFLGSSVVLAALAALLTRRPESRVALGGAAAVLAGLIGAYGLAVMTGVPLVHSDPEPVDTLAVVTKAVEGAGLLIAAHLLRPRPALLLTLRPKGT